MTAMRQARVRALRLRSALIDVQAAAPGRVEGQDDRGAVRLTLAPDGWPDAIRVLPGWRDRIAAEEFGAAVEQAFAVASARRVRSWPGPPPVGPPTGPAPADGCPIVVPRIPRPVAELAEGMVALLAAAGGARPAPATGGDQVAERGVVLTISASGLRFLADPRWLREQTGRQLDAALHAALGELRTAAQPADRDVWVDELLAEALAALDVRRGP